MKKHTKHSERDHSTGTMGSVEGSPHNMSTKGLLECSVTLEKLDMDELNKSTASHESNEKQESPIESTSVKSQLNMSHPENMLINMDVDTIDTVPSINNAVTISESEYNNMEYSQNLHMVDIEPDHQLHHEQNLFYFGMEQFNATLAPLSQNFEANAYDAQISNQNHSSSIVEIDPEYRAKEEKMDVIPILNSDQNVVFEVLDSDEEEALNSQNSERETNDTIIDLDSKHTPTMGVLMLAKK